MAFAASEDTGEHVPDRKIREASANDHIGHWWRLRRRRESRVAERKKDGLSTVGKLTKDVAVRRAGVCNQQDKCLE